MRSSKTLLIALLAAFFSTIASAQPPKRPQKQDNQHLTVVSTSNVVDHIIRREQDEMTAFALYKPLVETYIQELRQDRKMGVLPDHDHYYLGQVDLGRGVAVRTMLSKQKLGLFMSEFRIGDFDPRGFLELAYVDRNHFDKRDYSFHYAGQGFLGDVRCLMFDLEPRRKHGTHFNGRIWVEDRTYTIVRFSGAFVPKVRWGSFFTHFDSWRVNVQSDLWLPAYVFTEELHPGSFDGPPFKGQTRFWGYSLKPLHPEGEYSDLFVDPEAQVQDDSAGENHDLSPVQQERAFQRQAEDNAIETLTRSGLIAPEGPVDKVLDTVLNNLEVTNNLDIEPEPRCRVMLTSGIELFSIGHTIVLSRGLLDVIPDEATLAVMLAQELSDSMLMKQSVDQYGFFDVLQIPTVDAMRTFSFKDDQADWRASGERTLELLRNSPYRSKLGIAALFLKQLSVESKMLPHLISPHLGNKVYPVDALINSSVILEPEKIDQIAALPIGSRIKVNPWDDRIALNKAKPVALYSAREKMPFEITPFMPFLTRYQGEVAQSSGTTMTSKNGGETRQK